MDFIFNRREAPDIKPWWNFDLISKPAEEELHRALKKAHEDLEIYQKSRKDVMLQHLGLYKGIHLNLKNLRDIPARQSRLYRETRGSASDISFNKMTVNHLRDVTDSAVARIATTKPAATVIPNHSSEFSDKAKAKVTKMWLDSFSYENNIDALRRKAQQHATIFGESWTQILWDDQKGDVIRGLDDVAKMGAKVTVMDDEGKTHAVSQAEKTGDVGLKIILPFRIFMEPVASQDFVDVAWLMHEEWEYLTEVRLAYPEVKDKIKPEKDNDEDYFPDSTEGREQQKVQVITLWHKSTRELPDGLKIKFTVDTILEKGDNTFTHGQLPFERLTFLDVPGELNGGSPYTDLKELQSSINQLYSIMIRDRSLASPKLVVPAGTIDPNANKTNKPGIIEYKGGVPPTWQVPNMVSNDILIMIDRLEATFEKLSNTSGTRRGDSLPNVEAFKAFGFFEEQATKRDSTQIAKHRDYLERLYLKILVTAAQFYSKDDKRIIKIIGKHNQYLLKSFDVDDLTHSYDIRVQTTSALPDTKGQRIQTVIELSQAYPTLFTQEKIVDMLDLSTPDAFFDQATAAVNAAEQENDMMMSGKEVQQPQNFEDLLLHWESHLKQFSDPSMKETLPEDPTLSNMAIDIAINGPGMETIDGELMPIEIPEEISKLDKSPAILAIRHLHTTEGLIFDHAMKNPTFAMSLLDPQFKAFPVFFDAPLSISELVAQHQSPIAPQDAAPPTGTEQQITLPPGNQGNPNDFTS